MSRTIKFMLARADCFNYVIPANHSKKQYQRKIKLKPQIAESDTRKILCARNLIFTKLFFRVFVNILNPFVFLCVCISRQNDWHRKKKFKVIKTKKNSIGKKKINEIKMKKNSKVLIKHLQALTT